jgi:hypothetical protein
MKTPEQMAEEWSETQFREQDFIGAKLGTERAFLAGYQAAMNSPEKQDSWISVKDRLPEEDVAVLVYGQILNDPPDIIGVRRRYNGDQEWKHTWESEDGFIYREDDVTHWTPLPKPPEE